MALGAALSCAGDRSHRFSIHGNSHASRSLRALPCCERGRSSAPQAGGGGEILDRIDGARARLRP